MFRLSEEPTLSPLLREYFAGAFAAFVGMLFGMITGGNYMPHPEQTYYWFSLGLVFAYWKVAGLTKERPKANPFGLGIKRLEQLHSGAMRHDG
jgi:hypothetical protein